MPPARPSTRARACSASATPAARRSRRLAGGRRSGGGRASRGDGRAGRARPLLLGPEDGARARGCADEPARASPTSPPPTSAAIVATLVARTLGALEQTGARRLAVVGGVAANGPAAAPSTAGCARRGIELRCAPLALCGDNAAMIGAAAGAPGADRIPRLPRNRRSCREPAVVAQSVSVQTRTPSQAARPHPSAVLAACGAAATTAVADAAGGIRRGRPHACGARPRHGRARAGAASTRSSSSSAPAARARPRRRPRGRRRRAQAAQRTARSRRSPPPASTLHVEQRSRARVNAVVATVVRGDQRAGAPAEMPSSASTRCASYAGHRRRERAARRSATPARPLTALPGDGARRHRGAARRPGRRDPRVPAGRVARLERRGARGRRLRRRRRRSTARRWPASSSATTAPTACTASRRTRALADPGARAGHGALVGTTETLLAGLDHALDPNGDGACSTTCRVVVAPVAEPFAAFAESPEAMAAPRRDAPAPCCRRRRQRRPDAAPASAPSRAPAAGRRGPAVGASDGRPAAAAGRRSSSAARWPSTSPQRPSPELSRRRRVRRCP